MRRVHIKSVFARYAFSIAAVAVALGLRIVLTPLTGRGAPFVLFFGATLATSIVAGVGPALVTLALSLPIAVAEFVLRAGYPLRDAVAQACLYAVDGLIILYITLLLRRRRESLEQTNRQLQRANEEREHSLMRVREAIELTPDAYLLADSEARYINVNRAACELLGYERDELIGKKVYDIITPEDAPRLRALRTELLGSGGVHKGEWLVRRKDGTLLVTEVSTNGLPDGNWQAFVRDISERKRIEDLRQVYVSLLDNSPDFIGIADPTFKPIYVNPAGRRMVGLPPDYPVERTSILDYYPAELHAFVSDKLLKEMLERGQWSGETYFQNFETGARIPVWDTHFMIRDASGRRTLGHGTITRDISEARRIEERFRLTFAEAPIGMALVALEGRFVRVNRAFCDLTGYSADELSRLTFQDITHPDDVDTNVELARRLAADKIPRVQVEKRYVRKDGSIVDVLLSAAVVRGPDGAARHYITQVEDISERKRTLEALRLSEAKFSGLISTAADAIIFVDSDQRISIFNEGAEEIFGYDEAEMIGSRLARLIPERLREKHNEHFAMFAAGTSTTRRVGERLEIFGLRKNGEEFPAEASISKVTVGGTTFFSVVLRDITYRKSVEAALQRAIAARDKVLGIVAHDLRNPLNTIVMQAQMLERAGPRPERRNQKPRLVITRSAQRMEHLIQDLLDVARMEDGRLTIEPERLSAGSLVREAFEMQAPLAASAGLEIRREVGAGVPDVWGDRNRLLQVFENLVGNALKFTKEGGCITIGANARNHEVEFFVADTGIGIPPERLAHIFDRFSQVQATARAGAGLGLQISKGIVEAHGGSMRAESTPGRGTTFFFTIPAAAQDWDPASALKLRGQDRSHKAGDTS